MYHNYLLDNPVNKKIVYEATIGNAREIKTILRL